MFPNWAKVLLLFIVIQATSILFSFAYPDQPAFQIPTLFNSASEFIQNLQQNPLAAEARISKLVKQK